MRIFKSPLYQRKDVDVHICIVLSCTVRDRWHVTSLGIFKVPQVPHCQVAMSPGQCFDSSHPDFHDQYREQEEHFQMSKVTGDDGVEIR